MLYNERLNKIYSHSPVALQNLFTNVYGFGHYRGKYGKYFKRCLRELLRNQLLSLEELKEMQDRMLRSLIAHAYENVPYYRKLFDELSMSPEEIRTSENLRRLPVLEKETVVTHHSDFISRAFVKPETLVVHSSGTTGKALSVVTTKRYYQREMAFRWRHRSWAGLRLGKWGAYLAGHPVVPIEQKKPPFWRFDYSEKRILFSSYHMTPQTLGFYAEELLRRKPAFVHGYPSSVYLVSCYLLERGLPKPKPKAVFTASETLLDYQREVIEKAFGAKVFNWYGNTEVTCNIVECEHGSLHLCTDYGILELLTSDGELARPGQEGIMVCTGLGNYAMPLIRYRVGDVAVQSDKKCRCGRAFPVVERITGRIEDYVLTPDGRIIGRLDHIFKDTENVREAQIVQKSLSELVLRIVKQPAYSKEDTIMILENARNRVGESIKVKLEFMDSIPRESSGKYRFVVSRLPFDAGEVLASEKVGTGRGAF